MPMSKPPLIPIDNQTLFVILRDEGQLITFESIMPKDYADA
jgi:hypothetical protein